MSKHQVVRLCAGLLVALSLGLVTLRAQEPAPAKEAAVAKEADQDVARRSSEVSHRVPPYFGQIGLTPEQREKIYAIRDKHQEKIDELEKQIDEARKQMLTECEAVLTDAQTKLLDLRRRAATKTQGRLSGKTARTSD